MPWINQGGWVLWCPDNTTTSIHSRYYISQTIQTSTTQIIFPQYTNNTSITTTSLWIQPMLTIQNISFEERIERRHQNNLRHQNRVEAHPIDQYTLAENRARQLLLRHLDREQKNDYENDRSFIVISKTRRRYKITTHSVSANILRLDDREVFCIHGDSSLPMSDHFLAQKLMIEYDEETFLAIANRHGRR